MTSLDAIPPHGLDEQPGRPPRRVFFFAGLLAIVALFATWIYVLFIYDPGLLIDELADRRFPVAAEEVCARAVAELQELPPASAAPDAAARADTVEQSNVILTRMVADLVPHVPAGPPNIRDGVNEWLDDWRTYIGDRRNYVANLRADPEARFLESPKGTGTKGVTRGIDSFAEVNRMDSCTTPGDVS
jgi:hypothetical protein